MWETIELASLSSQIVSAQESVMVPGKPSLEYLTGRVASSVAGPSPARKPKRPFQSQGACWGHGGRQWGEELVGLLTVPSIETEYNNAKSKAKLQHDEFLHLLQTILLTGFELPLKQSFTCRSPAGSFLTQRCPYSVIGRFPVTQANPERLISP